MPTPERYRVTATVSIEVTGATQITSAPGKFVPSEAFIVAASVTGDSADGVTRLIAEAIREAVNKTAGHAAAIGADEAKRLGGAAC